MMRSGYIDVEHRLSQRIVDAFLKRPLRDAFKPTSRVIGNVWQDYGAAIGWTSAPPSSDDASVGRLDIDLKMALPLY